MAATQQPPSSPPVLGADGDLCASCGAPLAVDQRYCLNCGTRRAEMRLPFTEMALRGAELPPPDGIVPAGASGDASRPVVLLVSLIVLLLALGIGVLVGRGARSDSGPAQINVNAGSGGTTAAAFTPDWPVGKEGWTVQLQTLAATTGAAAVSKAKADATAKGATAVGALRSDDYPSLPPGAIVVYSGAYDTAKEARAALAGIKRRFSGASVVQVAKTAGGGSASSGAGTSGGRKAAKGGSGKSDPSAVTLDKNALEKNKKLSPSEFRKKSKKLPDKVGTGGKAPPTDNKAPGGGSGDAINIG